MCLWIVQGIKQDNIYSQVLRIWDMCYRCIIPKGSWSMDHHEDGDWSDEISARITFLMDGWVLSPQCETLKWYCRCLLENKGTERDYSKKTHGCLSTHQCLACCCSCMTSSLTWSTSAIHSEVAVSLTAHIHGLYPYGFLRGADWLQ